jgi:hypothetical protein
MRHPMKSLMYEWTNPWKSVVSGGIFHVWGHWRVTPNEMLQKCGAPRPVRPQVNLLFWQILLDFDQSVDWEMTRFTVKSHHLRALENETCVLFWGEWRSLEESPGIRAFLRTHTAESTRRTGAAGFFIACGRLDSLCHRVLPSRNQT